MNKFPEESERLVDLKKFIQKHPDRDQLCLVEYLLDHYDQKQKEKRKEQDELIKIGLEYVKSKTKGS